MSRQAAPRTEEIERRTLSGYLMVAVGLALIALAVFFFLNLGVAGPLPVRRAMTASRCSSNSAARFEQTTSPR